MNESKHVIHASMGLAQNPMFLWMTRPEGPSGKELAHAVVPAILGRNVVAGRHFPSGLVIWYFLTVTYYLEILF
jgi:hypothetical protein